MAAGAENAVGKGAVVCQQHKAGGVLIQPPGGEQPFAPQCRRHQIQYRRRSLAVRGREHPCGFVEHQIHKSPAGNGFACQANLLGVRVCLLPGASHYAVHSHLPLLQQRFDPAAGLVQLPGQYFFDPFAHLRFSNPSIKPSLAEVLHRSAPITLPLLTNRSATMPWS